MSRKRNRGVHGAVRRPDTQNKQNNDSQKQTAMTPLMLLAKDGFINRMAYLGEASLLSEANDFERHSITRDYELLTVMYRENWIAKRIIDTPCEDMTRSWYTITSAMDQELIDDLMQLEAKHNVKQEITNGLRWGRLYGGAAAVIVIKGQEDMLDHPLNYDDLVPGCFRGLIIVDRTSGLDPSVELEEDMDDPEFGYPKYYTVRLEAEGGRTVQIHHSRMLFFRGRMLPIIEEAYESYWGASELEHVYEELQKRNSTSANIAQLVFQANVGVLKMADYGEIMGMGTDRQKQAIYEAIESQNRIRNSFGMMIMGNEDGFEQHPYSFSGLSEIYESFMMDMAGAAEIPATKLYGRSPQGMNATGESDMKNYYEMLAQLQERNLRPAIEKLLPIMCMSLWGVIPNDMKVVFEPLQVTTPAERAQIMQQVAGTITQVYTSGLLPQRNALMELQKMGKDIGAWESITEELLDKAEEDFEQGEDMQDPMMGGMMPGMEGAEGMEGAPEEAPQTPEDIMKMAGMPSEEPQNAPETASEPKKEQEPTEPVERPEDGKTDEKEEAEDGGPGSGPRPGYKKNGSSLMKKPGMVERVRFMMNPTEGMSEPKRQNTGMTGNKAQVAKMNREREDWSNLTTHQRVKGNQEQAKHMAQVKAQMMKAASKGDLETAKKIVRENRHYFSNDPDSEMKVQSETLARQKAVKPRKSFIFDAIAKLVNAYAKDEEDGDTGWRTTEGGKHYHINEEGNVDKGPNAMKGENVNKPETWGNATATETPKMKEPEEGSLESLFADLWNETEEETAAREKEEAESRKAEEEAQRKQDEKEAYGQFGLAEEEYPEELRLSKSERDLVNDVLHGYRDDRHRQKAGAEISEALGEFLDLQTINRWRAQSVEKVKEAEEVLQKRKDEGYKYSDTNIGRMTRKQRLGAWSEEVHETGNGALVGKNGVRYWQNQKKDANNRLKDLDLAEKIVKRREFAKESGQYLSWRKNPKKDDPDYAPWNDQ